MIVNIKLHYTFNYIALLSTANGHSHFVPYVYADYIYSSLIFRVNDPSFTFNYAFKESCHFSISPALQVSTLALISSQTSY